MSEPLVSQHTALEQLRKADERWKAAVRGLDDYPQRLRTLADAAEHESRALMLAELANVKWSPRKGARDLRLAHEVEQESGRPGPAELWARFDKAVSQLGRALEGERIKPIADAFEQLSIVAREIAEACEKPQARSGARRQRSG